MLGTLTIQEIDEILAGNMTGRLGCTDGKKVYVVPVSYAFNETYLIAHSHEGMKINMMRKNPGVCFEVDEIRDFTNWRSVILWGNYEEITDQRERFYAMKFLVGRLLKQPVSETAGVHEMHTELAQSHMAQHKRPVIYRIRIQEKTGRFEKR
jgi:nitroimidazol reductase NimA-like FMN-containing flavoprotein (pyridoxamine 5'-phosphate oxidase superfamily)